MLKIFPSNKFYYKSYSDKSIIQYQFFNQNRNIQYNKKENLKIAEY